MGKKEKIKKEKEDKLDTKDDKKEEKKEDKDKVSLKKCFRDTSIILVLLVGFVSILWFVNKDKVDESSANKDEEINETVAIEKLSALANKELVRLQTLAETVNYIERITSLQYSNDQVLYCASGTRIQGSDYFIRVKIDYTFENATDFIKQVCTMDVATSTKFAVTAELYTVTSDDTISDKFVAQSSTLLPNYSEMGAHKSFLYTGSNPDETYISTTYEGSDDKTHSINRIVYDSTTDEFTVLSEYSLGSSDSFMMFKLLNSIIE